MRGLLGCAADGNQPAFATTLLPPGIHVSFTPFPGPPRAGGGRFSPGRRRAVGVRRTVRDGPVRPVARRHVAGDRIPGDTTPVPPDTVPGDTTGNPGGGRKTSLLVVQVGAQAQDTAAVIGVGPAVFTVSRGNHLVAVDTPTSSGYGSLQLAPGRYTVRLVPCPGAYQLAPGETDARAVVLTPRTQGSAGFALVRRP